MPRAVENAVESQLVLLLDDDLMITEGLAAALERDERTIVTCNDIESAQLIVERIKPSHIVADIHLSGPFGFEGLDFIAYTKRFSPETRIILISGDAPAALQLEGAERGAVAFLQKPFEIPELDALLDMMSSSALSNAAEMARIIRIPVLDEIIESEELNPFFQPLVALNDRFRHIGYESLARYRSESPLRNPELLFGYATRKHRVADLERACMKKSLEAAATLPEHSIVFLNVHPDAFEAGTGLADTLIEASQRSGVSLQRVVLEITEQANLADGREVSRAIHRLHDLGIRFAFDDLGVAYSQLPVIDKFQPSFLKVSQHFGTDFEQDATKEKIVNNLLSLANDFDAALVLEGIETKATAVAAAGLGIQVGQGFYFGRPADVTEFQ